MKKLRYASRDSQASGHEHVIRPAALTIDGLWLVHMPSLIALQLLHVSSVGSQFAGAFLQRLVHLSRNCRWFHVDCLRAA